MPQPISLVTFHRLSRNKQSSIRLDAADVTAVPLVYLSMQFLFYCAMCIWSIIIIGNFRVDQQYRNLEWGLDRLQTDHVDSTLISSSPPVNMSKYFRKIPISTLVSIDSVSSDSKNEPIVKMDVFATHFDELLKNFGTRLILTLVSIDSVSSDSKN